MVARTFEFNASNPAERGTFLREFGQLRGPVKVTVRQMLRSRTTPQNSLMWMYIESWREYLLEQGDVKSKNLLYALLCDKFLGDRTSSQLDVQEMTVFLNQIRDYLIEWYPAIRLPTEREYSGEEASHANHG